MSDFEDRHLEGGDAGASKTFPQQAGAIRKNGYVVVTSRPCKVPYVSRKDYQLIDISEEGFVSLLTDAGNTKDDLRLPTDETLLNQIKEGFGEGKDLVVSVMSAMGEEQICARKDIGPKS